MSTRIQIVIVALLGGVVAGIVAKALGFAEIGVEVTTGIAFALLVGAQWWWWNKNKSSHLSWSPNSRCSGAGLSRLVDR